MASPSVPSFADLEQAALHILRLIRDTPGLENTRLAVIGDLATAKYLKKCDRPSSIELIISKSSSPGRVRKEIVGHPMTPLVEKSGTVFYKHANNWEIEVKLTPDWLCPYLPSAARPVRDDIKTLPYVSLEDLLVFKVDACGLHESPTNKRREAVEAAALLEIASEHSPLVLEDAKTEKIEQALRDIVEFSAPEHDKSWWQRRVGKMPDNRRSAQEIFSELSDHAFSPTSPTSPISPLSTTSSSSSIHSSMSRTSSSSSTSTHSASSSISSASAMGDKQQQADKNGRPRKMSITGKAPRHKRHTSITGSVAKKTTLDAAMQRMDINRPASPGVALTNKI